MRKIYIAGHTGLVGSAVLPRALLQNENIVVRTRQELDLTRQEEVEKFFEQERPDATILCAARVGGIVANIQSPYDFISENITIQSNVINAAKKYNCEKFCFLGSSCIYPKLAPQPIKEEYLLTSSLEISNRPYAISKIAGLEMISSYRRQFNKAGWFSLMPTNLYGPNDSFDPKTSHAFPALIRKFYEAKIHNSPFVELFGTGKAYREFLHCDDLADIIVSTLFMDHPPELMNVGTGKEISIHNLALLIKEISGYEGEIRYDSSKPDGTPRKVLDISKMTALGLSAKIGLRDGIKSTLEWYVKAAV